MKSQTRKSDAPLGVIESTGESTRSEPFSPPAMDEAEPTLWTYVDAIVDARWIIAISMSVALALGALHYLMAPPTYLSDVMVQVEEKKSTLAGLDELAGMFGSQSPADTEIEILRSRTLLGLVIDELALDVVARPRFFPVIGHGLARRHDEGEPASAWLGLTNFAWGGERIALERLEVPKRWEGKRLTLVAKGTGEYELLDPAGAVIGAGGIGQPLTTDSGVALVVSDLAAREGTQFIVQRLPRSKVVRSLQGSLAISEKGKKTGVLLIALEGEDPARTAKVLDAIARTYLRQNIERKSAEAEKTLEFITAQLPQLKVNVDKAEAALNEYRKDRGGGLDLSVETKAALDRAADIEKLLTEIELQSSELRQKFTGDHPTILSLNKKAAQLKSERNALDQQFKALPETQLNAARLTRDVKVSSELYFLLMNRAQELQVMKSGTIGNVRILDAAIVPDDPVSPRAGTTLALSLLFGGVISLAWAFARKSLDQGVDDPELIERELALPVYASIPHSKVQQASATRAGRALAVLAVEQPRDLAIEAVRSLRTSVQFALAEARNNVVVVVGPSPGIGKSFVSVNLAFVIGDAGKRVLLIDADMRKGGLHRYCGGSKSPGLSDVIRGVPAESAVRKTVSDNVQLLTMGEVPANPSELLSSRRFEDLVAWASGEYDVVLIDTAPILAVTDATLVCRVAGTNLVVLRAGQHPLREIAAAVKRMGQNGVSPRAVVFNDVMPKIAGQSRYGYNYHYEYK